MHTIFEILTLWLMLETGAKCVLALRGGGKLGSSMGSMGGGSSGGGGGSSYKADSKSEANSAASLNSSGDVHFGAVQISAGAGTNSNSGGMNVSKWILIGLAILIPGGALLAVYLWRKFRK